MQATSQLEFPAATEERAAALFGQQIGIIRQQTDRMFAWLMAIQWLAGVVCALVISPQAWEGLSSRTHLHVWAAVFLGGVISGFPVYLAWRYPGQAFTRHVVAVGQMLTSALLIHLSGGRIETHFHIFGSLAFLAIYQDWRVILSATIVVALDHALRGTFWPQSVFGVLTASPWRWTEHAAWVLFEDTFLLLSIRHNLRAMFHVAEHQAKLERINELIEQRVVERTQELEHEISERKIAERERQMMEVQLRQSQKLEAIGQLAAGIAHEINTPTQYVGDNAHFLRESWDVLAKVLHNHQELLIALKENRVTEETAEAAEALLDGADLDFLYKQIPISISATLDGVERVAKIVRAMKEFAHPGSKEKTPADLNHAIESTVTVSRSEWRYVADLKLDLEPSLPRVPCFVEAFNQSVLNLIVNAAHAIEAAVKDCPETRGTITIQTRSRGDHAEIRISDTGTGIAESVRPHIFEPFFTTKEVGKGSGQGLSIVYASIVNRHGGDVTFESQVGKGTTFILRLPFVDPKARTQEAMLQALPYNSLAAPAPLLATADSSLQRSLTV
jgi:signal transduction histidine kinase